MASSEPELNEHAASVLVWVVKLLVTLAGLVGSGIVGFERIAKPYGEWRARQRAEKRAELEQSVQAIIGPYLAKLDEATDRYKACADQMVDVFDEQQRVLLRQTEVFHELSDVLVLTQDNRDRWDETNQFLDRVGFTSERRGDPAKRAAFDEMIEGLMERQRDRRRMLDAIPVSHRLGEGEHTGPSE